MNISPTSDEKVTAALVHGSIFLLFLGPIVPVIVWISQRKKSKYVSFHALQAMGYQALIFWLWIVAMILMMALLVFLIPLLSIFMKNSHNSAIAPFIFQMIIFTFIFGLMGIFFLTGIIGAVYCLLGRNFRYPFLGKWLERYLSYDEGLEAQMDETHEDNWVAGICHATAILQLWGVMTPLIVWFTQKERSVRLRFQAMQAFLYQLISLAAYIIGMALYMVFFLGIFITLLVGGTMNTNKDFQGPVGIIMMVSFGIIIIFWLVFAILVPIYYLLAGFASVHVIRGHDFRYPIIGKIIEKRMGTSHTLEPVS